MMRATQGGRFKQNDPFPCENMHQVIIYHTVTLVSNQPPKPLVASEISIMCCAREVHWLVLLPLALHGFMLNAHFSTVPFHVNYVTILSDYFAFYLSLNRLRIVRLE